MPKLLNKLYRVTVGEEVHLVEAKSHSEAINCIVKHKAKSEILSGLEAAKMVGSGHVVRVAGS